MVAEMPAELCKGDAPGPPASLGPAGVGEVIMDPRPMSEWVPRPPPWLVLDATEHRGTHHRYGGAGAGSEAVAAGKPLWLNLPSGLCGTGGLRWLGGLQQHRDPGPTPSQAPGCSRALLGTRGRRLEAEASPRQD